MHTYFQRRGAGSLKKDNVKQEKERQQEGNPFESRVGGRELVVTDGTALAPRVDLHGT